jgi:hypothetical protein
MLLFLLGALQTIEYNLENNIPIPWQAFVLIACVFFWCMAAYKCKRASIDEALRKYERFLDELFK